MELVVATVDANGRASRGKEVGRAAIAAAEENKEEPELEGENRLEFDPKAPPDNGRFDPEPAKNV